MIFICKTTTKLQMAVDVLFSSQ